MEFAAYLMSSAVRFVREVGQSDVHPPDLISAAQARYRFWEIPRSAAEYNFETGVKFGHGMFSGVPITYVQLFTNGIIAQATANTSVLDELIDDMMSWSSREFGLRYEVSEPVTKGATSAMEVRLSADLLERIDRFSSFTARLTEAVRQNGVSISPYQLAGLQFVSDPSAAVPVQPGRFVFERRTQRPFAENVFYTEAPVSSDAHLQLLEALEAAF